MMAHCSKKAYLKRRLVEDKDAVDTNVFQVKFDKLKENIMKVHQGDPVLCKQCESVLNKFSKLDQDVQNEQFGKLVWVCEFCNHKNQIQIEKEEVPQSDDVIYLLQSAQEQQMQVEEAENSIVFCIDNSGSMSTTVEIKGKVNFKHGISNEEYEMLKQFIDPGDEHQIWPQFNTKYVTHVSRKQCVMAAIEQQINELKKKNPNKIVGLITFNNEVVVYGDGSEIPITITGDRLFKKDEIEQLLDENSKTLMKKPVKEQANELLKKFEKLQEKGQTALGPALVSALQLVKIGKPGSMIIICTDGLANLGLGSLDNDANKQFYEDLGQFASQLGVVISIVTIKGEGCKVDILGTLVEKTNGTITRVKPEDIEKDFANILKDELVGTQIQLCVQLHRALKFRGEDNPNLTTTLKRDIGNATIATIQTFEYQLKTDQELEKEQIDIKELKNVPFQIKVYYTNLNGDKLMRVVTSQVSTTENKQEAEEEAEVEVIHKRMAQKTAQIAKQGKYSEALKYNQEWDDYVQGNEQMNRLETNCMKNMEYKGHTNKIQTAVCNQAVRKGFQSYQTSSLSSQQAPQMPQMVQQQKIQVPQMAQMQQPPPQQQMGFLDRMSNLFKGDLVKKDESKKAKTEQVPQSQSMKKKKEQPQQQQQQKQQQKVENLSVQRKESIDEEDDEDAEMADLLNFEQGKY